MKIDNKELADAIDFYRKEGLNLLPITIGDKTPAIKWKHLQTEKVTDEEIKRWFLSGDYNIGVVCGEVSDNLFVIDFDDPEIFRKFWRIEDGLFIVKTGRGFHVWFKADKSVETVRILDDAGREVITLKGEGSIVVAPPSIHPNGSKYEFYQRLDTIPRITDCSPAEKIRRKAEAIGLYPLGNGYITDIDAILRGVNKGSRDNALIELISFLKRQGASEEDIKQICIDWNKRNNPPLPIDDVLNKIEYNRDKDAYRYHFNKEPGEWIIGKDLEIREISKKTKAGGIADKIMQEHEFRTSTNTKTIYVYDGGIYRDNGEVVIEREVEKSGEKVTNHLVSEVIGHIRRSTYTDEEEFNRAKFLPVENGLLDLEDLNLHRFDKNMIFTYKIDIRYDPSATCPNILKFIGDVVQKEDINTIQEFLGYCLYPDMPAHKSMWLYGSGSNGKTQFAELIRLLVGRDNTAGVELEMLDGEHRFEIAGLYGKLVNIISEPATRNELKTPLFKKLTGGDMVHAEIKNKQNKIKFKNFAKFIIDGNKFPRVDDDTHAFWRRILAVNFVNKFEGKNNIKNIAQQLWANVEERSGFLNWCLEGLQRLKDNNWEFSESKSMDEIKLEFHRQSNPAMAFISDMCEIREGAEVGKEELYDAFKEYCDENGLSTIDKRGFTEQLQSVPRVRAIKNSSKGGRWFWVGIGLKDKADGQKDGWF